MRQLAYIPKIIKTNIESDIKHGSAFWITNITMFLQNYIFLFIWFCIFNISPKLGEWRFEDFLALEAVVMMAFGLCLILAGGSRTLAEIVETCQLDSMLTRPKNLLLSVLTSRTKLFAFGDFTAGITIMGYLIYHAPENILPIIGVTLLAAISLMSFFTIIQSFIFWKSGSNSFINQMIEFFIILSCNPQNGFGPKAKFILHTLLPAAYIGYLPVEIIREPTTENITTMLIGTTTLCAVMVTLFYAGLKRYKSGNIMYQVTD